MAYSAITESMARFCKDTCPVCTRARQRGQGALYQFVKLEESLCPACRSYKKVYGVPAHKNPESPDENQGEGFPEKG